MYGVGSIGGKHMKLEAMAKGLAWKMYPLKEHTVITIVDDSPHMVEGFIALFRVWRPIETHLIIPAEGYVPTIPRETRILLLDEDLDPLNLGVHPKTGWHVYDVVSKQTPPPIIISISIRAAVEYVEAGMHFRGKEKVSQGSEPDAIEFIDLLNPLLKESDEKRRLHLPPNQR
jgi:hypothetical protein